jgi:hypothetical protein
MTKAAALGLCAALVMTATGCKKPAPRAPVATNAAPANAAAANAAPAAAAAPLADAADAADAKAFLDGLYAHYKTSKGNSFNMFDTNEKEVFDPDTIGLLKEDLKALKGDLGVIDGDWLCDCQDFVSLQATVTVTAATPTMAKASSDFKDTGMPEQGVRHDDFDLVKTPAGWRIHDVTVRGEQSLRTQVSDEIKSLKAGGNAVSSKDEAP